MELLIAIMMYFGIITSDATFSMSTAEIEFMYQQNKTLIDQASQDPGTVEAATTGQIIIDRRED